MENLYLDLESARHSANLEFLRNRVSENPEKAYKAICCKGLAEGLEDEMTIIFDTLTLTRAFTFGSQENVLSIDIMDEKIITNYIASFNEYRLIFESIGYPVSRLIELFQEFRRSLTVE